MKIVILGATGFIGKMLFTVLLSEDHDLSVVTRNADQAREILGDNALFYVWDGKDQATLRDAFNGAQAIINLAGENISAKQWTEKQKQKILESRIITTNAIVNEINRMPQKPEVLLQASAVGYYGSSLTKDLVEDSPAGEGFLADVTRQWENEARKLDDSVRLVLLRTGIVLGPEGGALSSMTRPFKFGFGGHAGSGKQWFSWIHLDDEVEAIRFLLENKSAKGVFNLTAPHPVRMKTFSKELGRVMKKNSWMHIPPFIVRILMGSMGKEMILSSQKVLPKRLLDEGFKFQFDDIRMALMSIYHY